MSSSRTALVVGASGAIGSAVAKRLGVDGFNIVLHARTESIQLGRLRDELEGIGRYTSSLYFDVCDADSCKCELESLLETVTPQVVVYAAGVTNDALFGGMSEKAWHGVIDSNLNGFYNVLRPLLMPMVMTRWGRVIPITSISGVTGNQGQANYAASKAGVIAATKSIAFEVARKGVTANSVAPGIIESRMTRDVFTDESIKQLVPVGRRGTPDEVAGVVSFLASDDSAYVTGQVISVNGGMR